MSGTLVAQTIQGPSSGANANKVLIPSGHTLHAAGHVVQVQSTLVTERFSQSATIATQTAVPFITLTITPKLIGSWFKVYCRAVYEPSSDNYNIGFGLLRNSVAINQPANEGSRLSSISSASIGYQADNASTVDNSTFTTLDKTSYTTLDPITYQLFVITGTTQTFYFNQTVNYTDNTSHERHSSEIIVEEIAQ